MVKTRTTIVGNVLDQIWCENRCPDVASVQPDDVDIKHAKNHMQETGHTVFYEYITTKMVQPAE